MKKLIDCAMKRTPCDLVVRNVKIFNVFTGELEEGDLGIAEGKIVGISAHYEGRDALDGSGTIALPGFMDAHIHIESTLLSPEAFLKIAASHGTTGVVADPHELTNVCGIAGAEYVQEAVKRVRTEGGNCPMDVYLGLPSCVPATPFETSGAIIDGRETEGEIKREGFHALAEMMNFPAVLNGDEEVLRKIASAKAVGKVVDGHAPALSGDGLNAYASTGILTDHEPLTVAECREKIARGMYVQLRNGSSAPNILQNYGAIDCFNFRRFLLCSDDKNASDLSTKGHIDDALRTLVKLGVPAEQAVCMATKNIAECYGLTKKGALAPGYDADLVLVDNLKDFTALTVVKGGEVVARQGEACFSVKEVYLPEAVKDTVRVAPVQAEDFRIPVKTGRMRAMQVQPYGLVTDEVIVDVQEENGDVKIKGTNLLKLAVVERHFATGNIGLGLVKGYGFHGGALGITVAHDSHNLVVLGDDNRDVARVVELLKEAGGGMALVDGEYEEVFPLDIAGLMSSLPLNEVIARTASITARARKMGVQEGYEPFMTLAFLSLVVIPKLKLTDKGLFDLEKFSFVEIDV